MIKSYIRKQIRAITHIERQEFRNMVENKTDQLEKKIAELNERLTFLRSEKFLDGVVQRLNRKQLK